MIYRPGCPRCGDKSKVFYRAFASNLHTCKSCGKEWDTDMPPQESWNRAAEGWTQLLAKLLSIET